MDATQNIRARGTTIVARVTENEEDRISGKQTRMALPERDEHRTEIRTCVEVERPVRHEHAALDGYLDWLIHECKEPGSAEEFAGRRK